MKTFWFVCGCGWSEHEVHGHCSCWMCTERFEVLHQVDLDKLWLRSAREFFDDLESRSGYEMLWPEEPGLGKELREELL